MFGGDRSQMREFERAGLHSHLSSYFEIQVHGRLSLGFVTAIDEYRGESNHEIEGFDHTGMRHNLVCLHGNGNGPISTHRQYWTLVSCFLMSRKPGNFLLGI